ncbi:MAG TPA: SlyX family protein [Woeseiaceae bacterium]|nr:SlyX family protein [Woeseiaceae bacterium]
MTDDRLIDIETRLTHQDQALHELNEVMTQQQASIMKLERLCAALAHRLADLGAAEGDASLPDERPPHY